MGDSFLSSILKVEAGYTFLHENNWLEYAIQRWNSKGNAEYVEIIEKTIFSELSMKHSESSSDDFFELYLPLDSPLEIRSNPIILKRLPFQIFLKSENNFGDQKSYEMLFTYVYTNESNELLLIGKTLNKLGVQSSMKFDTHLILKCCLKIGDIFVDNYCKPVSDEFWIKCDQNDRKQNLEILKDGNYCFEKGNINFIFKFSKDPETWSIETIIYKLDFCPKILVEKTIPKHLYGELAKSEKGIEDLKNHKIVELMLNNLLSQETSTIQKRAALWALGNIGSNPLGLVLIKEYNVIPKIIDITENSDCLSIRGSSIYSLGLISKTLEGKSELEKYNWICHSQEGSIICVPNDAKKIFNIKPYEYLGSDTVHHLSIQEMQIKFNFSKEKLEILKQIDCLSNHPTQKAALAELKKIASQTPDVLNDVKLFYCVDILLTYYNFKPNVRRYILNLFETLMNNPKFLEIYNKEIRQNDKEKFN